MEHDQGTADRGAGEEKVKDLRMKIAVLLLIDVILQVGGMYLILKGV